MADNQTIKSCKARTRMRSKKGFDIIRQKHQGLGFVNTSSTSQNTQTWTKFSRPPARMKFVTQKNVDGQKKRRRNTRKCNESDIAGLSQPISGLDLDSRESTASPCSAYTPCGDSSGTESRMNDPDIYTPGFDSSPELYNLDPGCLPPANLAHYNTSQWVPPIEPYSCGAALVPPWPSFNMAASWDPVVLGTGPFDTERWSYPLVVGDLDASSWQPWTTIPHASDDFTQRPI